MPYLFLFAFIIIPLSFIRPHNTLLRKYELHYVCIFLLILILTLFYGLRYNVGIDYMTYYKIAESKKYDLPLEGKGELFEPAFRLIYKLVDFFCLPPNTLFLFGGFIIYAFIFMGLLQYSRNYALSLFIFYSSGLYFFSFNEFRQFIAVSIIFFGYRYCIQRNLFKWTLIVVIAFLYHKTALLAFPMYYLCALSLKKSIVNVLVILTLLIKKIGAIELLCTIISFIPGYFGNYAEILPYMITEGSSGIIGYVYMLIIFLINNCPSYNFFEFKDRFFFNLFLFASIFINVFYNVYMVGRLMEYFSISLLVLYPTFYIQSKRRKATYIIALLITFLFTANFFKFVLYPPKGSLLEYHTVFNKYGD